MNLCVWNIFSIWSLSLYLANVFDLLVSRLCLLLWCVAWCSHLSSFLYRKDDIISCAVVLFLTVKCFWSLILFWVRSLLPTSFCISGVQTVFVQLKFCCPNHLRFSWSWTVDIMSFKVLNHWCTVLLYFDRITLCICEAIDLFFRRIWWIFCNSSSCIEWDLTWKIGLSLSSFPESIFWTSIGYVMFPLFGLFISCYEIHHIQKIIYIPIQVYLIINWNNGSGKIAFELDSGRIRFRKELPSKLTQRQNKCLQGCFILFGYKQSHQISNNCKSSNTLTVILPLVLDPFSFP